MPAGPPPITKTSKWCRASLFIDSLLGRYFHALLAQHLTTPNMRIPVDRHATLKADFHPTQRAARLTAHSYCAGLSGHDYGNRDGRTRGYDDRRSVDRHCDLAMHAHTPSPSRSEERRA